MAEGSEANAVAVAEGDAAPAPAPAPATAPALAPTPAPAPEVRAGGSSDRRSGAVSGRMHFLDALRGLAALSVMVYHFHTEKVSPIHDQLAAVMPSFVDSILSYMYCGVEIFFVLSGFVIAYSMDGNRHNVRYAGNFIVRRSLRLDPPYWTTAGVMLGVYLLRWPNLWHDFYLAFGGGKGILANMFYVQNLSFIYPAKSILDVSWTLCLEVQFYLSYLVVLTVANYVSPVAGRHKERLRQGLVVLPVAAIALWSFVHWVQTSGAGYSQRSWMFFLGVGLYLALGRRERRVSMLGVVGLLAGGAAWRGWCGDVDATVALVTAATIYAVGSMGRFSTFLAYRPLLHLGKISYSLYLVHLVAGYTVLSLLSGWVGGRVAAAWLAWAAAVAVSLLVAELLHRVVEAPSNRLSQRLKPRKPPATVEAAMATEPGSRDHVGAPS